MTTSPHEESVLTAGFDAGSRSLKVVLLDTARRSIVASAVLDQAVNQDQLAHSAFAQVLDAAQVRREDVRAAAATGAGRHLISLAGLRMTEITCHARGVNLVAPEARTLIEIGGQDSKFIRLAADGTVEDFAMNDRCAAGTGRFLEVVAARLGVPVAGLGDLARQSRKPANVSSMCVVFAETEILGLLAEGTPAADIAAGVQRAVATRAVSLAARGHASPVYFTGGVATVSGMDAALAAALELPVRVCPQAVLTGALGAAWLAASRLSGG